MKPITKCTSTTHTTAYKNRNLQFIAVHYTAGLSSKKGSAISTAKFFAIPTNKGGRDGSADFIVDDVEIVQYNPDIKNRYTWHCGGAKQGKGGASYYNIAFNRNTIGIEVCSTNTTNPKAYANDKAWSYSEAVIKNTEELVEYLMKEYNIKPENVIRHYDVTGKACPGIIGWNGYTGDESKWKNFKKAISSGTVQEKAPQQTSSSNGYVVEVTSDTLNLRQGPSTDYKILEVCNKGDRIRIVGYKGKWLQTDWNKWLHGDYVKTVK